MTRSRSTRLVVSVLIAAVVLALLYGWGGADWREMGRVIASLSPSTFAAALAIHTAIYIARAERFRILIPRDERPPRWPLLWVTSAHNLAVYALPAKTGEATLPVYLNATCGTRAAAGIASLVVSRILDLASLTAIMAFVSAMLSQRSTWNAPVWTAFVIAAGLLVASVAFFLLAARGDRLVGVVERLMKTARLDRGERGARLISKARELREALRIAGASARLQAAALSFVIWILIFAFYVVLARGFGLPDVIGPLEASFGASLAVAMNLLPINSFAGFGTQEAGWVFGFGMVGVAKDAALASGLGAHLVQIFDTLLFGVLGHLAMAFARRR